MQALAYSDPAQTFYAQTGAPLVGQLTERPSEGHGPSSYATFDAEKAFARTVLSETEFRSWLEGIGILDELARPVLLARDADDVTDCIDAMVDNAEMFRGLEVLSTIDGERGRAVVRFQWEHGRSLQDAFGAKHRREIRHGLELRDVLTRALGRIKGTASKEAKQAIREAPLAHVAEAPIPIARALLGGLRGLAGPPIFDLARRTHPPEGKIARAIIQTWIGGMKDYLCYIAAYPETNVPESVIPASQRLNLQEVIRQEEEYRSNLIAVDSALPRGTGPRAVHPDHDPSDL